jgi:hypothetical protein
MPIYEYECEKTGEVFELIWKSWKGYALQQKVACQLHNDIHAAEKIWSLPGNKNLQCAEPTIVFKNPRTGEMQVATHKNDQPPIGFEKVELRGPIERSRFEKEASERKHVEDELTTEKLKQGREQTAKNIHDDIKARMNSQTNKIYNPETKQEENVTWDERTKGLMKLSMQHTRKKHEKIKPKRTNVRLEINHTDSSNLVK